MKNNSEKKLIELFDRVVEGSCADEERGEFSRLLDENPQLKDRLLEQLHAHGLLHWSLSPTASPVDFIGPDADLNEVSAAEFPVDGVTAAGNVTAQTRTASTVGTRRWRHWAAASAVLAASILIGLFALLLNTTTNTTAVGTFAIIDQAIVSAESTAVASDKNIVPGTLVIESGQLAIEFVNGVEMKVNGPATLSIESDMLVHLVRGQATADVPRWARGFTIATPDIEIVDLGTRFGVAKLEDVKTDVVVFEGEVDIKSLEPAEKKFARRLTQGEAARINYLGEIERIFEIHGDAYDNEWSTLARLDQGGVVSRVWDNLNGTKSVSYYQVMVGGLGEDAPAYVDHPHQWNALTDAGLPEFLRHADYVRTINDYRYMGQLSIQVQFAGDADLYVFFDNRVRVPEWLSDQFEDTGYQVGLDEDAWHGNPTFSVEVGPGNSIDNVFTVYRRSCAAGETMVLGSMGIGQEARAMYGIAATPRKLD